MRSPRRSNTSVVLASLAAIAGCAMANASLASTPAYAVSGRIAGPDGGWDYASFDPVHRRVYVSRSNGLTALDVDTGVLTGHLADGARTHEPLVLPGGDQILLTNGGTGSALLLNAADGTQIASIPTAPFPDGALFDPASGLAVTFGASGVATLIDAAAKGQAGQITIGGKLEFGAADGHGGVFVNVESAGEIASLDIAGKAVKARYKLADCDSPGGLAYAAKADVLIASCDNGVAKVVASKTGKVLATLPIGKGPDAVIYDAERGLAFIPCGHDGVLEVIAVGNGADAKVIQTVKTEVGARTGALDPKTGKLYLPTVAYGSAPAGGGRAPATPGTFHLVVVSPAAP